MTVMCSHMVDLSDTHTPSSHVLVEHESYYNFLRRWVCWSPVVEGEYAVAICGREADIPGTGGGYNIEQISGGHELAAECVSINSVLDVCLVVFGGEVVAHDLEVEDHHRALVTAEVAADAQEVANAIGHRFPHHDSMRAFTGRALSNE